MFPEGWLSISVPYQWIPTIAQNLKEMDWELPHYKMDKDEFREYEQGIFREIAEKAKKP